MQASRGALRSPTRTVDKARVARWRKLVMAVSPCTSAARAVLAATPLARPPPVRAAGACAVVPRRGGAARPRRVRRCCPAAPGPPAAPAVSASCVQPRRARPRGPGSRTRGRARRGRQKRGPQPLFGRFTLPGSSGCRQPPCGLRRSPSPPGRNREPCRHRRRFSGCWSGTRCRCLPAP